MKDASLKKMVMAALFAALTCVATMVIRIPSPMNGYVNLGDCVVLLSGWLLGPWYGFAAAAVGSMLADVCSGYAHYAVGTFLIKGAMGAVAGGMGAGLAARTGRPGAARIVSGAAAEFLMVWGYFAYAGLWLGKGLAAGASVPGNVVQGVFGMVVAACLAPALERAGASRWLER